MTSIRDTALDDMQFINCLASSVQWTAEENTTTIEVVKINETENFAFIMGLYRGACNKTHYSFNPMKQSTNSVSKNTNKENVEVVKTLRHVSETYSEDCSAVQLILAAAAIRRCGAYYGAWKMRRDIVMDDKRFTACCMEESTFLLRFDISNSNWLDVLEYYRNQDTGIDENINNNNNDESRNEFDVHSTNSKALRTQIVLDPSDTNVLGVPRLTTTSVVLAVGDDTVTTVQPHSDESAGHDTLVDIALVRVKDWGDTTARKMVAALLPSKSADFLISSLTGDSQEYSYCPVLAVRWELEQSRSFAVNNHKNFQVWHHRQELLAFALSRILLSVIDRNANIEGTKESTCDVELQYLDPVEEYFFMDREKTIVGNMEVGTTESKDNKNKRINGYSPIDFSAIDERIICDEVFEKDSKNYHVWSHRSWFVATFRFLHIYDVIRTVASITDLGDEENEQAFVPSHFSGVATPFNKRDIAKGITGLLAPCLPSNNNNNKDGNDSSSIEHPLSHLQSEINYSSKIIEEDVFNNSAWSYRMMLVRSYVMPPITAEIRKHANEGPSSSNLSLFRFLIKNILVAEIEYALSYAAVEVCNECPFTYANGICALATDIDYNCMWSTPMKGMSPRQADNDSIDGGVCQELDGRALQDAVIEAPLVCGPIRSPYCYFPHPLQMLLTTTMLYSMETDIFPVADAVERDIIMSINDALRYARPQIFPEEANVIDVIGKERNDIDSPLLPKQGESSTTHDYIPPSEGLATDNNGISSHGLCSKYAKRSHFVKDNIHQPLVGYYNSSLVMLRCMMAETPYNYYTKESHGEDLPFGGVLDVRVAVKEVATARELIKLFSILTSAEYTVTDEKCSMHKGKEQSTSPALLCGVKSSLLASLSPIQELIEKVTMTASEKVKERIERERQSTSDPNISPNDETKEYNKGTVSLSEEKYKYYPNVLRSLVTSIIVTLVRCLKVARQLYEKDTIRLKYWRLQIKMLLHYEYC